MSSPGVGNVGTSPAQPYWLVWICHDLYHLPHHLGSGFGSVFWGHFWTQNGLPARGTTHGSNLTDNSKTTRILGKAGPARHNKKSLDEQWQTRNLRRPRTLFGFDGLGTVATKFSNTLLGVFLKQMDERQTCKPPADLRSAIISRLNQNQWLTRGATCKPQALGKYAWQEETDHCCQAAGKKQKKSRAQSRAILHAPIAFERRKRNNFQWLQP